VDLLEKFPPVEANPLEIKLFRRFTPDISASAADHGNLLLL
jgi:hypothetical protein